MYSNLTDKQLRALRWIVQKVNNNELGESFQVASMQWELGGELLIEGLGMEPPEYLDLGVLDALVAAKVLIEAIISPDTGRYTLTRKAYEIADFDFTNPTPAPLTVFMNAIYVRLRRCYDREELKSLCSMKLGIQPDWVLGDSKDQPLELLLYVYRQRRLHELPAMLREERPHEAWPDFPDYGDEKTNV